MKRRTSAGVVALAALAAACAWSVAAHARRSGSAPAGGAPAVNQDGPQYSGGTNLIRPANYREWVFLSSSLGLTYQPPGAAPTSPAPPNFGNVFVNPSSYRNFMQTGKWPDKTIFVLEVRQSAVPASVNKDGRFQTGLGGIEAEVKDSRFPDGWAFFNFGPPGQPNAPAPPLSGDTVARCIQCHTQHTAVERTFVQFYPTLLEVAKRLGTVKPNYTDP